MSTAAPAAAPHLDLGKVDFLAGAKNLAEHIMGSLGTAVAAAADAKLPQVAASPGAGGMFFGTIANGEKAIAKIGEIRSDFEKKDVGEGVADGVDLLKLVFATLDACHIDLPVVTQVVAAVPSFHAGADKPA